MHVTLPRSINPTRAWLVSCRWPLNSDGTHLRLFLFVVLLVLFVLLLPLLLLLLLRHSLTIPRSCLSKNASATWARYRAVTLRVERNMGIDVRDHANKGSRVGGVPQGFLSFGRASVERSQQMSLHLTYTQPYTSGTIWQETGNKMRTHRR